jgi:serine protease
MRRRLFFTLVAGTALLVSTLAASPAAGSGRPGDEVMGAFHGKVMPLKGARGGGSPFKSKSLSFRGGSVQTATKVYISYWGTEWSSGFSTGGYSSATAQTYVQTFFGNVGGSSWINSDTQYCQNVPSGTTNCSGISGAQFVTNPTNQYGGAWNDTTPVPAGPSQSQIAAAAIRAANHFTGSYSTNATYLVFTPTGKSMSGFGTSWCAWHSSTIGTVNGNSVRVAYGYIPYMPDAGASCGRNFINSNNPFGNGYFDGFSVVAGHEYEEAQTDPFPNGGWLDNSGNEDADKCAWSSLSGNISLGGHTFAVQPLWSNASNGCVLSY